MGGNQSSLSNKRRGSEGKISSKLSKNKSYQDSQKSSENSSKVDLEIKFQGLIKSQSYRGFHSPWTNADRSENSIETESPKSETKPSVPNSKSFSSFSWLGFKLFQPKETGPSTHELVYTGLSPDSHHRNIYYPSRFTPVHTPSPSCDDLTSEGHSFTCDVNSLSVSSCTSSSNSTWTSSEDEIRTLASWKPGLFARCGHAKKNTCKCSSVSLLSGDFINIYSPNMSKGRSKTSSQVTHASPSRSEIPSMNGRKGGEDIETGSSRLKIGESTPPQSRKIGSNPTYPKKPFPKRNDALMDEGPSKLSTGRRPLLLRSGIGRGGRRPLISSHLKRGPMIAEETDKGVSNERSEFESSDLRAEGTASPKKVDDLPSTEEVIAQNIVLVERERRPSGSAGKSLIDVGGVKIKDGEAAEEDDIEEAVDKSPDGRFLKFAHEIGRGSFKTVYRGLDSETGVDVAWCELMERKWNKTERLRFREEAEMLKGLQHPNIVRFYDYWEVPQQKRQCIVLVTELMTSGTLKTYLRRLRKVNTKILKRWCQQILKGLCFLHSRSPSIIHRDLKCDNIFITGTTGSVKIGDLGLATLKNRSYAKSVIGTPEFMAPEVYDEHYDEGVDVYAFGMCMMEMATLEYPYGECSGPAQIYRKVTSGVRPLSFNKIEDEQVREIIDWCTKLRNEERPTVKELLEHEFFQDDSGMMVELVNKEENINSDSDEVFLQLRVTDPKKRKDKHKENEAIQFDFTLNSDTPDRIVEGMVKMDVIGKEDEDVVARMIKNTIQYLKREREERRKKDMMKEKHEDSLLLQQQQAEQQKTQAMQKMAQPQHNVAPAVQMQNLQQAVQQLAQQQNLPATVQKDLQQAVQQVLQQNILPQSTQNLEQTIENIVHEPQQLLQQAVQQIAEQQNSQENQGRNQQLQRVQQIQGTPQVQGVVQQQQIHGNVQQTLESGQQQQIPSSIQHVPINVHQVQGNGAQGSVQQQSVPQIVQGQIPQNHQQSNYNQPVDKLQQNISQHNPTQVELGQPVVISQFLPQGQQPVRPQQTSQVQQPGLSQQTFQAQQPVVLQQNPQVQQPSMSQQTFQVQPPGMFQQTSQVQPGMLQQTSQLQQSVMPKPPSLVQQPQQPQVQQPVMSQQPLQIQQPAQVQQSERSQQASQVQQPGMFEQTSQVQQPGISQQTFQAQQQVVPQQNSQVQQPTMSQQTFQVQPPGMFQQTSQIQPEMLQQTSQLQQSVMPKPPSLVQQPQQPQVQQPVMSQQPLQIQQPAQVQQSERSPQASIVQQPGMFQQTVQVQQPEMSQQTAEVQQSGIFHQTFQVQQPGMSQQTAQVQQPGMSQQTSLVQQPGMFQQTSQVQQPGMFQQNPPVPSQHSTAVEQNFQQQRNIAQEILQKQQLSQQQLMQQQAIAAHLQQQPQFNHQQAQQQVIHQQPRLQTIQVDQGAKNLEFSNNLSENAGKKEEFQTTAQEVNDSRELLTSQQRVNELPQQSTQLNNIPNVVTSKPPIPSGPILSENPQVYSGSTATNEKTPASSGVKIASVEQKNYENSQLQTQTQKNEGAISSVHNVVTEAYSHLLSDGSIDAAGQERLNFRKENEIPFQTSNTRPILIPSLSMDTLNSSQAVLAPNLKVFNGPASEAPLLDATLLPSNSNQSYSQLTDKKLSDLTSNLQTSQVSTSGSQQSQLTSILKQVPVAQGTEQPNQSQTASSGSQVGVTQPVPSSQPVIARQYSCSSSFDGHHSAASESECNEPASETSAVKQPTERKKRKKKTAEKFPKLSVLRIVNTIVECQLETIDEQTVTFEFDIDNDSPAEVTSNLVTTKLLPEDHTEVFIGMVKDIIDKLREDPKSIPIVSLPEIKADGSATRSEGEKVLPDGERVRDIKRSKSRTRKENIPPTVEEGNENKETEQTERSVPEDSGNRQILDSQHSAKDEESAPVSTSTSMTGSQPQSLQNTPDNATPLQRTPLQGTPEHTYHAAGISPKDNLEKLAIQLSNINMKTKTSLSDNLGQAPSAPVLAPGVSSTPTIVPSTSTVVSYEVVSPAVLATPLATISKAPLTTFSGAPAVPEVSPSVPRTQVATISAAPLPESAVSSTALPYTAPENTPPVSVVPLSAVSSITGIQQPVSSITGIQQPVLGAQQPVFAASFVPVCGTNMGPAKKNEVKSNQDLNFKPTDVFYTGSSRLFWRLVGPLKPQMFRTQAGDWTPSINYRTCPSFFHVLAPEIYVPISGSKEDLTISGVQIPAKITVSSAVSTTLSDSSGFSDCKSIIDVFPRQFSTDQNENFSSANLSEASLSNSSTVSGPKISVQKETFEDLQAKLQTVVKSQSGFAQEPQPTQIQAQDVQPSDQLQFSKYIDGASTPRQPESNLGELVNVGALQTQSVTQGMQTPFQLGVEPLLNQYVLLPGESGNFISQPDLSFVPQTNLVNFVPQLDVSNLVLQHQPVQFLTNPSVSGAVISPHQTFIDPQIQNINSVYQDTEVKASVAIPEAVNAEIQDYLLPQQSLEILKNASNLSPRIMSPVPVVQGILSNQTSNMPTSSYYSGPLNEEAAGSQSVSKMTHNLIPKTENLAGTQNLMQMPQNLPVFQNVTPTKPKASRFLVTKVSEDKTDKDSGLKTPPASPSAKASTNRRASLGSERRGRFAITKISENVEDDTEKTTPIMSKSLEGAIPSTTRSENIAIPFDVMQVDSRIPPLVSVPMSEMQITNPSDSQEGHFNSQEGLCSIIGHSDPQVSHSNYKERSPDSTLDLSDSQVGLPVVSKVLQRPSASSSCFQEGATGSVIGPHIVANTVPQAYTVVDSRAYLKSKEYSPIISSVVPHAAHSEIGSQNSMNFVRYPLNYSTEYTPVYSGALPSIYNNGLATAYGPTFQNIPRVQPAAHFPTENSNQPAAIYGHSARHAGQSLGNLADSSISQDSSRIFQLNHIPNAPVATQMNRINPLISTTQFNIQKLDYLKDKKMTIDKGSAPSLSLKMGHVSSCGSKLFENKIENNFLSTNQSGGVKKQIFDYENQVKLMKNTNFNTETLTLKTENLASTAENTTFKTENKLLKGVLKKTNVYNDLETLKMLDQLQLSENSTAIDSSNRRNLNSLAIESSPILIKNDAGLFKFLESQTLNSRNNSIRNSFSGRPAKKLPKLHRASTESSFRNEYEQELHVETLPENMPPFTYPSSNSVSIQYQDKGNLASQNYHDKGNLGRQSIRFSKDSESLLRVAAINNLKSRTSIVDEFENSEEYDDVTFGSPHSYMSDNSLGSGYNFGSSSEKSFCGLRWSDIDENLPLSRAKSVNNVKPFTCLEKDKLLFKSQWDLRQVSGSSRSVSPATVRRLDAKLDQAASNLNVYHTIHHPPIKSKSAMASNCFKKACNRNFKKINFIEDAYYTIQGPTDVTSHFQDECRSQPLYNEGRSLYRQREIFPEEVQQVPSNWEEAAHLRFSQLNPAVSYPYYASMSSQEWGLNRSSDSPLPQGLYIKNKQNLSHPNLHSKNPSLCVRDSSLHNKNFYRQNSDFQYTRKPDLFYERLNSPYENHHSHLPKQNLHSWNYNLQEYTDDSGFEQLDPEKNPEAYEENSVECGEDAYQQLIQRQERELAELQFRHKLEQDRLKSFKMRRGGPVPVVGSPKRPKYLPVGPGGYYPPGIYQDLPRSHVYETIGHMENVPSGVYPEKFVPGLLNFGPQGYVDLGPQRCRYSHLTSPCEDGSNTYFNTYTYGDKTIPDSRFSRGSASPRPEKSRVPTPPQGESEFFSCREDLTPIPYSDYNNLVFSRASPLSAMFNQNMTSSNSGPLRSEPAADFRRAEPETVPQTIALNHQYFKSGGQISDYGPKIVKSGSQLADSGQRATDTGQKVTDSRQRTNESGQVTVDFRQRAPESKPQTAEIDPNVNLYAENRAADGMRHSNAVPVITKILSSQEKLSVDQKNLDLES